jgi:hypothetical protein
MAVGQSYALNSPNVTYESPQSSVMTPQVQPLGSLTTTPGPSSTGATQTGQPSGALPTFSGSMTPAQAQALANQYLQAAGLPPDTGGMWGQYWTQFGQQDPNYFMTRLLNGAAQQGGNMSPWTSLQSSTAPGGWGPGTSGYGPAGGSSSSTSPYGTNGFMGSPGYAYEQTAANNAVQASAAARGTLLSTGTMKDLQGTAAGIAGGAFALDSSNLLALANYGQNATNQAAGYVTSGANAQAAGTVSGANQITNGANGVANGALTGYIYSGMNPGNSQSSFNPNTYQGNPNNATEDTTTIAPGQPGNQGQSPGGGYPYGPG